MMESNFLRSLKDSFDALRWEVSYRKHLDNSAGGKVLRETISKNLEVKPSSPEAVLAQMLIEDLFGVGPKNIGEKLKIAEKLDKESGMDFLFKLQTEKMMNTQLSEMVAETLFSVVTVPTTACPVMPTPTPLTSMAGDLVVTTQEYPVSGAVSTSIAGPIRHTVEAITPDLKPRR